MNRPFATVILAGGKGTRMGSSEKHKVCFEVLGAPVITRALETYTVCGSSFNVIVVGMMAESVMSAVAGRFPGTAFAYQDRQLGTGDAARKGAEILERLGFAGDVLVVAGDKVITPQAIRQLLRTHVQGEADVTMATAKRPANSSSGLILKNGRGHIVGILEEAERRRLLALTALGERFKTVERLDRAEVERIISVEGGERAGRGLLAELAVQTSGENPLEREEFERAFSRAERAGALEIGDCRWPARELLERFDQVNLSTYLFRAPVLQAALGRLKSARPSQEEYLTDVFGLLTQTKPPARVLGCEITDARELMAFNNPQELLAIEEVCREREGMAAPPLSGAGDALATATQWEAMLTSPSAAARRFLRSCYGEEAPIPSLREVVRGFAQRYGAARPFALVRSPGRINLMGRHIDHQGGSVNVMAINREILVAAAPRTDDHVRMSNLAEDRFGEQEFCIADLVARLNWDDWQRVIDGPRLQRLLEAARGDWANYIKASVLRLQEQFRDRRLRGFDLVVNGQIPMGAGLSSSSALVVAAAEMVSLFNALPVSARRLVSLCGEGEWFVGTRGGAADHAAIKLSRRGCVTRVGFFPFRVEDSAPFFPDHDLVVCNSGLYAGKSGTARNLFNAKVTAYHIGRVWFKLLRPELAGRIEHLRDIDARRLGLSRAEFAATLERLPAKITRRQVRESFTQIAEAERERLERLFATHETQAYPVRGVVLFGLAEMARARQCLDLLKKGDAAALGRLMRSSHDGDRVSRLSSGGKWRRLSAASAEALGGKLTAKMDLARTPGQYGCSLPELDRIADLAAAAPGVRGAQMAGAGLGGCVMVLARQAHSRELIESLAARDIKAERFRPIAGAGNLRLM